MLKVYYRTTNKKLRCVAADIECHKEAIQAVMEQLHIDREVFLKPVVALIEGGKA